jgi:predicted  nucleic acid-binding Zn-ribbon protein
MKLLIGLQNCDTQIRDIRLKKEEGPIKIQRLEDDLNAMKSDLKAESDQLEANGLERRRIEQDIEVVDSRIEKSNVKLASIKSNKEYQAALKEIDDLEGEKSLLEDQLLEFMEEVDALEVMYAASMAKGKELEEKFEKGRIAVLKQMETLDSDLEGLEKERARFCQAIDEDLLKRYNFLKERKGGLAVSPVIKGVCQTCHLGIPPQKFNELIRCQELLKCPNCHRIIYWGEDERFSQVIENDMEAVRE